ncbi:MAG: NAD(P)H-hydrate dehydratase, partial [Winogradskyella sp.]|nr:NAD(P)H-hydrate dehydratase [Winogradskyella sp.]
TAKYTANWEILDIGIDQEYLQQTTTETELIGKHELLVVYKPRKKFSHKGDYGHGLIIGGSYGKIGAVQLTARSVLTIGAGLVTAFIPKSGYHSLQTSLPEAMVKTCDNDYLIDDIDLDFEPTATGIGVGLGTNELSAKALKQFLKSNKSHLVIDADGLNLLSQHKELLKLLKENTILTPHPKELQRLIGSWTDDFDKLEKTKSFSKKHKVIVVIKGANTITVTGEKYYINVTGNPGMATGGSGDVLTGIIVGLLCQNYNPLEATLFGVYLHGKSGDLALESYGYHSLIASTIIDHIKNAFIDLFSMPEVPDQTKNEETNSN